MSHKPSLLFLATHPKEAASTRHRVLAYFPALTAAGFNVELHAFLSTEARAVVCRQGRGLLKGWYLVGSAIERWRRLARGQYDILVIHRELFPWGWWMGHQALRRVIQHRGTPVVYDFDDAMYLPQRQDRGLLRWLESPESVREIISLSQRVIAGNVHLRDYAQRFNQRVEYVPTPVDTDHFHPEPGGGQEVSELTIGWIGSSTTSKYLSEVRPAIEQLARTHRFRMKVVGAGNHQLGWACQLDQQPWDLASEAEEFRTCDIGIYPLRDDEWARGKCGFKALQFMASGVAVVASAVGMNCEIIQDGTNGLLARTGEEWYANLRRLLEEAALRRRLAEAGRRTVEERYSLRCTAPRIIQSLRAVLNGTAAALRECLPTGPALAMR